MSVRCRRCGEAKLEQGWGYVPKRKGEKVQYSTCPQCFGKPPKRREAVEVPEDVFASLHYDAPNK